MPDESKDKKILVIEEIEDDKSLREVIHEKFSHEGFKVIDAKNGEEGLTLALREHPDLIVLDILMPDMDGITVMEKLRNSNEWGKQVPIILLTNLSADSERVNKAIADFYPAYFILKSNYSIGELVEKIRERLSEASA